MFKKGEEDYRWPLLRASMSKPLWEIFTITFIAPAQNVLLACTAVSTRLSAENSLVHRALHRGEAYILIFFGSLLALSDTTLLSNPNSYQTIFF